ncbi:hypothetical protein C8R46DRAFT_312870 [Mycena filopes]|nr:hypothetical protein C8R46DRAFT_312870 [Mycena filopes]
MVADTEERERESEDEDDAITDRSMRCGGCGECPLQRRQRGGERRLRTMRRPGRRDGQVRIPIVSSPDRPRLAAAAPSHWGSVVLDDVETGETGSIHKLPPVAPDLLPRLTADLRTLLERPSHPSHPSSPTPSPSPSPLHPQRALFRVPSFDDAANNALVVTPRLDRPPSVLTSPVHHLTHLHPPFFALSLLSLSLSLAYVRSTFSPACPHSPANPIGDRKITSSTVLPPLPLSHRAQSALPPMDARLACPLAPWNRGLAWVGENDHEGGAAE